MSDPGAAAGRRSAAALAGLIATVVVAAVVIVVISFSVLASSGGDGGEGGDGRPPAGESADSAPSTTPDGMLRDGPFTIDPDCTRDEYRRACSTLQYAMQLIEGDMVVVAEPVIRRTKDGRFQLTAQLRLDCCGVGGVHSGLQHRFSTEPGWKLVEDQPVGHLVHRYDSSGFTPLMARLDMEETEVPGQDISVLTDVVIMTDPNPVGDS